MALHIGDLVFEAVWPGNTTPQAVDGTGTSPRSFCGFSIFNAAAAARFIRLFDNSVSPTMGTTLPKIVIPLATLTSVHVSYIRPNLFVNGMWVSVTTGIANNDNTAPAASDVLMNIFYQ
jgi:hypothetical protein